MEKKKKKKPLALILFLLPLVVGGVVVGLALTKVINIPGLTPKKKPLAAKGGAKQGAKGESKVAAADKPKDTTKPAPTPVFKTTPPVAAAPTVPKDLDKGAAKLAAVWGEMKPDELVKIIETYKDQELAPIFKKMDESAVAKVLAKVKPERAASISRALEASASELKATSKT